MKLVLIIDNDAWFWVIDDDTQMWEAWYETGEHRAVRVEKLDRPRTDDVIEFIKFMTHTALNRETK